MKAANERYKNLKQFEKKADDGSVVKCRAEHVEGRCWVVICTLDDKEFFRRECGSRREVDAAFSSGETLLEFKNYLYAQSTSK